MFMREEVKRLKDANPDLDHREAFKRAASNWAKSPDKCRPPADGFHADAAADLPDLGCQQPAPGGDPSTPEGHTDGPQETARAPAGGLDNVDAPEGCAGTALGIEAVESLAAELDAAAHVQEAHEPAGGGLDWAAEGESRGNAEALEGGAQAGCRPSSPVDCGGLSARLGARCKSCEGVCEGATAQSDAPEEAVGSRGEAVSEGRCEEEAAKCSGDEGQGDQVPEAYRCAVGPGEGDRLSELMVANVGLDAA
eukprot:evm.model.scf_1210.2 EVM.evm.TU.scf_1210.2   scf_1210:12282-13779(+)